MMQSRTVEIWVGLFIAAGMAALFMLAMQVSNLTEVSNDEGYIVTARFENISGLKVRSPVTMAGVRVGRVTDISLDPAQLDAVVTMRISNEYDQLPSDTGASIYTAGLLGEQYISLEAGGDPVEFLEDGSTITLTQSAVILEQLIGQLLFSKASEGE